MHQRFVKELAYKKYKILIRSSIYPCYYGKTPETLAIFMPYFVQSLIYSVLPDGQLLVKQLSLVKG